MFGKKNVKQGTRLLGSKALRRPFHEEEEKHSLAFIQTSSLSPCRWWQNKLQREELGGGFSF